MIELGADGASRSPAQVRRRPGGVFNEWLMKSWQEETAKMDAGQAAKKVDTDIDDSLLKKEIREHTKRMVTRFQRRKGRNSLMTLRAPLTDPLGT